VLEELAPVLGGLDAVPEELVVDDDRPRAGMEVVPVDGAAVLAPGSAKIVPNDGTKVEAEQQLPS